MNKFDLNTQWLLYLKRVGLNEATMHATQLQETKRAFYGACGQLLLLLRDDVSALEEEDAVTEFEGMINQVGNFWANEIIKN